MLSLSKAAAVAVNPVFAVGMAACSSSSSSSNASASASSSSSVDYKTTTLSADQVQVTGPLDQKPTVTFPFPSQAQALSTKDTIVGKGQAVTATDSVNVNYVGIGATSGKEFDASWTHGGPISFPLSGVIEGWQQGMVGMKVGGRRVLVIPGNLAYGDNPGSSDILPNETLVFVVDLVAIK